MAGDAWSRGMAQQQFLTISSQRAQDGHEQSKLPGGAGKVEEAPAGHGKQGCPTATMSNANASPLPAPSETPSCSERWPHGKAMPRIPVLKSELGPSGQASAAKVARAVSQVRTRRCPQERTPEPGWRTRQERAILQGRWTNIEKVLGQMGLVGAGTDRKKTGQKAATEATKHGKVSA